MVKTQKGFSELILLMIIAVIGFAGLFYYSWQKGLIKTNTQEITPTPSGTDEITTNWGSYRNAIYKYTFKYDSNYLCALSEAGKEDLEGISSDILVHPVKCEDMGGPSLPAFYVTVFQRGISMPSYNSNELTFSYIENKIPEVGKDINGFTRIEDVVISGKSGKVFEKLDDFYNTTKDKRIFIENDGYTYVIGAYYDINQETNKSKNFFNQILTTFKFIDYSQNNPSWETYVNNYYNYSISYPTTFNKSFCENCNPPEITVSITNIDKKISMGIEYAHQFTACANYATPCKPVQNLDFPAQFKKYEPEEYYDEDSNLYIFKIDLYQITISGSYTNIEDAKLVSQILSTFKILDSF